ncbi:hypothetical protein [Amycolatopsis rubida]|uniref:Uncharacterized protein n=1 Tax=Amycolatopsis rubida TaxID=112413 RepID=A0A1I5XBC7_9PSEU|nr:hypothetical protein [Amycolatopsis rubida]SFQ29282.1 hypothetical protein SAMN05421854_110138 [Amycolatopsis rubida]
MTGVTGIAASAGGAHPAAVVLCVLLLVGVPLAAWVLARGRRAIPPTAGRLTVQALRARLAEEISQEEVPRAVPMPCTGKSVRAMPNSTQPYRSEEPA